MGLFKSKGKIVEKDETPIETKEEDPLVPQFTAKKRFNEEKISDMLTFIYDSITNEKIDLTNLEWSLKLDDNRKLIIKIEQI